MTRGVLAKGAEKFTKKTRHELVGCVFRENADRDRSGRSEQEEKSPQAQASTGLAPSSHLGIDRRHLRVNVHDESVAYGVDGGDVSHRGLVLVDDGGGGGEVDAVEEGRHLEYRGWGIGEM